MATATKPRAKARMSVRPVEFILNASEGREDEIPDATFKVVGRMDDEQVRIDYTYWPRSLEDEDVYNSYLGIYVSEIDPATNEERYQIKIGADLSDITPDQLRLISRALSDVAAAVERQLPRRLAEIRRAYGTINATLDELYGA